MTEDGKGDAAASAYGWLEGHAKMNTDARWLLAEVERLIGERDSQREQRIRAQQAEAVMEEHLEEARAEVGRLSGLVAAQPNRELLLHIQNAVSQVAAEFGDDALDAAVFDWVTAALAALREDGEGNAPREIDHVDDHDFTLDDL